ncbi:nucleotidyltransferase family protein [Halomonas stenophila]|uniref:Putative nucleotidyltransferase n=1 Tax=Halomonas stenophila TaxID=795312 RepID=A0A7W5EUZ1_9GAMM|nr:nucleotidyltransferase domain-containing protein [Halomonas stenophila]MBB3231934.1 putative nucleotidyltransferase [Halomonas stenophila]
MKPSQALQQHRDAILRIIARHRGLHPRVYGSVAHGEDEEGSDLDILIDVLPDADLFDLGAMHTELEDLLGVAVDVKTIHELPPSSRAEVLSEAIELSDSLDINDILDALEADRRTGVLPKVVSSSSVRYGLDPEDPEQLLATDSQGRTWKLPRNRDRNNKLSACPGGHSLDV